MSLIRVAHVTVKPPDGAPFRVGEGLRLAFNTFAAGEPQGKPNVIRVWNLSRDTVANIKEGHGMELVAGYDDDSGPVVSGQVSRARTRNEGLDRVTEIQSLSAEQSVTVKAKFTAEYPAGPVKLRQIVMDCAAAMKAEIASIEAVPDVVIQDFASSASAKAVLRQVLEAHDSVVVGPPRTDVLLPRQGAGADRQRAPSRQADGAGWLAVCQRAGRDYRQPLQPRAGDRGRGDARQR